MENNTNLKKNLQDFIEERINGSYTNIANTKEYRELLNKNSNLMESIINKVKNNELVEEYKETEYDMHEIQLEQAYLTGFRDSTIIFSNKVIFE